MYAAQAREEDRGLIGATAAAMSEAGRSGDLAQVPMIVQAVQGDLRPFLRREGLQALARLGAIEALSLFDEAPPAGHEDESSFIVAARARLLAEAEAKDIPDSAEHAGEKIRAFFRHLETTHDALNADLYTYRHPPARYDEQGRLRWFASSLPSPQPVVIYALRQLADMVYQGAYPDYAALRDVRSIHFHEDYGSALKMRLAPLPRSERLPTLIDEISRLRVLRGETYRLLQLAANEGAEAGVLAVKKLAEMEARPDDYSHIGFTSLFMIIAGLGDSQYEPLLRRFFEAPGKVNCKNLLYYDVRDGIHRRLVSAY